MSINIKRPETLELVRKLAHLRGEGLPQIIHTVLGEAYNHAAAEAATLKAAERKARNKKMRAELAELQAQVKAYKVVDPRPWREILYDEDGLPQ